MFAEFSLHVHFFCYWLLLHASDKLEVEICAHFSSSDNYFMPKWNDSFASSVFQCTESAYIAHFKI